MAFVTRRPGKAAIAGKALTQAVKGSYKHPQCAILFLNDHVLIKAAHGNVGVSAQHDSFAFVCGCIYVGELLILQAVSLSWNAAALITPDRAGEKPCIVLRNNRLIHHNSICDSARRRPNQRVCVCIFASDNPNTAAPIVKTAGLRVTHP